MKFRLILKKFMTIFIALVILLLAAAPAVAQENKTTAGTNISSVPSQGQGPNDPVELEAFLDDLMAKDMEAYHIAGAAVAVVKDGMLFFTKGYGYADLDNKIPVDPEQTIFRIGSVGKVLTWMAVMQQVEQGKLDLDADVNTYLDFRIPDTYPQPITLKHLLTHTSGFEDRVFGSVVSDVKDLMPVREWLISHMSKRVSPPGYAGYSNYNAMLAGYIVSRVSGKSYDQYIQEHIFDPLGMAHSTVRSPMLPDLRLHASVGYTFADDAFQILPDYIGQPAAAPSGAHQASVTDMARFMIASLQGGFYGDASTEIRILEETTAQQMLNTLYTADPRIPGTTYGLFDWTDNGQFTLGHSGYSPPMHSVLLLLPDQNLGVYVNYNSEGSGNLTNQHTGFQRAFFDHYYPDSAAAPVQPLADSAQRASRFVGSYNTIKAYTTLVKMGGLFGGGYLVEIRHSGDGVLLFSLEGLEFQFVEVEPLYFRQVNGPFSIVFREDDQERITHLFTDIMPQYAEVKLNWYETPSFNIALALGSVLLFLSTIPVAVFRFVRDRRRGNTHNPDSGGARAAFSILLGISVLNLLFLVGVMLGMPAIMQNILLDPPIIVKIALGLGVLSAILTIGALVYTVLAWKNRYWGFTFRTYYTLVTVAAAAFVWFLNYWNLLGWRL